MTKQKAPFLILACILGLSAPGLAEAPNLGTIPADNGYGDLQPLSAPNTVAAIHAVVILATNSVHIHQQVKITGDVVVNDASPGPTLVPGFELGIDRLAMIQGDVRADSVRIARGASVSGTVFFNDLTNGGASLGGQSTPLALPVFASLPPFQFSIPREEAEDVFVGAFETVILEAKDYGAVHVAPNGTLIFAGGLYNLRSLKGEKEAQILFDGPADLRIQERLRLGRDSVLGPATGSPVTASEIILYVGGINGSDGFLTSTPAAAVIDQNCTLAANLYVPFGSLILNRGISAEGAFFARDVLVARNVHILLASFFINRPPVAFPQDVVTHGADPLEITLRGEDPEGEDLVFSIVTGPTEGTLGPVIQDPPPSGPGDPPRTTARVTYTPFTAENREDGFTFQVQDPAGGTGMAGVRINPPELDEPPPPPPDTVVVNDFSDETFKDTPLTVTLEGDAPAGVDLTFAILAGTGPTNGTLSDLTQGTESPRRSATVVYTPNPGHLGEDSFQFEACGTLDGALVCDQATATITTIEEPVEESELAPDQEVTTVQDQPVEINLTGASSTSGESTSGTTITFISGKAAFLTGAAIAGNVADSDGDGLGDNRNNLPGSSPVLMSAFVDGSGGAGSNGTGRMHMEWDVSGFAGLTDLESATVILSTHRGTIDSLDTFFFFVGADGNGALDNSDFEAPAEQIPGVVMPVPSTDVMPIGSDGTFSFDVTAQFQVALDQGFDFFSVQGRVDETLADGGSIKRGLEVRTTADGNLADNLEPKLAITTPGVVAPLLTFTIVTLPSNGTLRDSTGALVTTVPTTLPDATVTYTPNPGFFGLDSFTFEATDGVNTDTGTVTLNVLEGNCETSETFCDDGRGD